MATSKTFNLRVKMAVNTVLLLGMKETITVTSPLLPDLKEFERLLENIWERKWITNNGVYHKELERALASYLRVPYISLFSAC